jgi:pimeloyl-ACP methyl ester carboxylesterase
VASAAANCRTVRFPVTLPDRHRAHISGEYCTPHNDRPAVLQVAVHGGTYHHTYWTGLGYSDSYDYVGKAVNAGYAVLAVDRLGDGTSTRPASTQDTEAAQISSLRQVIEATRAGALGLRYHEIEYVGHSFGSYYGVDLVSKYPHLVDALLLTGYGAHTSAAIGKTDATDDVPASYLPRFRSLDTGYITNRPGTRADHLYYVPDADPGMIARDQATEDTLTRTEVATRPASTAGFTEALPKSLPVLIIDGNHDLHYCTPDTYDCTSTSTWFAQENGSFPQGACVAGALEESGHDLQLHRSAPATDALMLRWSRMTVPADGASGAHCALRGALPTADIRR